MAGAEGSAEIRYDPSGGRYRRSTATFTKHYAAGGAYERIESAIGGGVEARQHFGPSVVVTHDATGRHVDYLHLDRLGSVDLITDELGEVEGRYGYDPFGGPRDKNWHTTEKLHSGSFDETTDRGFTGHEHLDDQRLIHMNGRTYDYRLGRFLSVDPVISDLADSQTLNPYSYVRNNPLGFTDPSGFESVSVSTDNGRYEVETVAQTLADGRQVDLVRVTFEDGSTVTFDFAAGYVSWKGPAEDVGSPSLAAKAMEGIGSFLNGVLRGLVGWQHSGAAPGFEDLYALGQVVGATAGLALDAHIAIESLSIGAGGALACAGGATCAVSPVALSVAGTGLAIAYEGGKFHTAMLAEGLSNLGDGGTNNGGSTAARGGAKLPRFNGPKPKYHVNEAHVRGSSRFNPKKTPLPKDAETAFKNAVPDDPVHPRNWYGTNDQGTIYRFSGANDGTAHFSGMEGVGPGIRNISDYALRRLGRL